jgi:cytochrome b561
MLSNTQDRYGLLSRSLHWITALFVIGLLAVGLYMTGLDKEDPSRLGLYNLHKSFGATVLALTILRVLWILRSPAPPPPAVLAHMEVLASKTVKTLLYLLLFFMPLSGWIMSNAAGYAVSVFGLFDLPQLVAKSHGLHEIAEEAHELAAYGVIALVLLHIAGTLKHRYLDKDPQANVLSRML